MPKAITRRARVAGAVVGAGFGPQTADRAPKSGAGRALEMRSIILFYHLAVLWLMWSGYFTSTLLLYGALSCALVVALSHRIGIVNRECLPFHLMARGLVYMPWLLWEVARSNIAAARIILDPKLPIRPQLLRVPAPQKSEVAQVLYANSITLTPGTLTLELEDGELLIHSLAPEFAEGVESGEMERRVCWVEEGKPARKERIA